MYRRRIQCCNPIIRDIGSKEGSNKAPRENGFRQDIPNRRNGVILFDTNNTKRGKAFLQGFSIHFLKDKEGVDKFTSEVDLVGITVSFETQNLE